MCKMYRLCQTAGHVVLRLCSVTLWLMSVGWGVIQLSQGRYELLVLLVLFMPPEVGVNNAIAVSLHTMDNVQLLRIAPCLAVQHT